MLYSNNWQHYFSIYYLTPNMPNTFLGLFVVLWRFVNCFYRLHFSAVEAPRGLNYCLCAYKSEIHIRSSTHGAGCRPNCNSVLRLPRKKLHRQCRILYAAI